MRVKVVHPVKVSAPLYWGEAYSYPAYTVVFVTNKEFEVWFDESEDKQYIVAKGTVTGAPEAWGPEEYEEIEKALKQAGLPVQ